MCGRYVNRREKQEIARRTKAKKVFEDPYLPDFNIAPTTFQPIVRQAKDDAEREMVLARWGLLPFFADPAAFKAITTINARAETVATAPSFREPFKRRRCLVPADLFYEWKLLEAAAPTSLRKEAASPTALLLRAKADASPRAKKPPPPKKQPYVISLRSGESMAFAGLWDAWREPKKSPQDRDTWLQSFTIITTEANELMSQVHTRMPVILPERDWQLWLDREFGTQPGDIEQLRALLRPFDSGAMQLAPCNPLVGNVKNNGPEMLVCPQPGPGLPLNSL